jgi:two-component system, NarL family, nitrate/nitrite response regulator NarL
MDLRIVVVEHERFLRRGLERLLSATPGMAVVGGVESIYEAENLPSRIDADVILAGADLPDMDGTAGIPRLLARFPYAQVVILGPGSDPGLVVGSFRAGADGYLTRDISPDGLVRALQGIERGEAPLPRSLTYLLVEAIRYTTPQALDANVLSRLSPREREVLREIARGHSNTEIATHLGVSESTVKTHVSNILRKTGSRSRFLLQAVGRE